MFDASLLNRDLALLDPPDELPADLRDGSSAMRLKAFRVDRDDRAAMSSHPAIQPIHAFCTTISFQQRLKQYYKEEGT